MDKPLLFFLVVLLAGCGPAKKLERAVDRVLDSDKATAKVVAEYVKRNPVKNDTFYLPGKDTTILQDTTVYDSIYLEKPIRYKYTVTRYIDRIIRDTFRIIDRSLIGILETRVRGLEEETRDLRSQNDTITAWGTDWKGKAGVRLWILIAAGILVAAIIALIIILQIKFTIKK
jgi:hypothetical protein